VSRLSTNKEESDVVAITPGQQQRTNYSRVIGVRNQPYHMTFASSHLEQNLPMQIIPLLHIVISSLLTSYHHDDIFYVYASTTYWRWFPIICFGTAALMLNEEPNNDLNGGNINSPIMIY